MKSSRDLETFLHIPQFKKMAPNGVFETLGRIILVIHHPLAKNPDDDDDDDDLWSHSIIQSFTDDSSTSQSI